MTTIRDDSPENVVRFASEVRSAFQIAMDLAQSRGKERNLSSMAICTAIYAATIRCQALAIVGGQLPLEGDEISADLDQAISSLRSRMAERAGRRPS